MSALSHKIDFAIIFSVKHANPNGDPLNGNRPRTDYDGFGEVTDVCLKRKIRDRLQTEGSSIFVQSDEKKTDGMVSLKARAESDAVGLGKDAFNPKKNTKEQTVALACEKWLDVRSSPRNASSAVPVNFVRCAVGTFVQCDRPCSWKDRITSTTIPPVGGRTD